MEIRKGSDLLGSVPRRRAKPMQRSMQACRAACRVNRESSPGCPGPATETRDSTEHGPPLSNRGGPRPGLESEARPCGATPPELLGAFPHDLGRRCQRSSGSCPGGACSGGTQSPFRTIGLSPYVRRHSPVPYKGFACALTDATTRPRARLANQRRSPLALSSAVIFSTASSTSEGLRAPVQTTLPLPNRRITTLGSSMRYTRPGNCSGSYST